LQSAKEMSDIEHFASLKAPKRPKNTLQKGSKKKQKETLGCF
jgi:hypothetical protein